MEDTKESVQTLQNRSFDAANQLNMVEVVEFDGTTFRRQQSGLVAMKVTVDGSITYIAKAPVGSATSAAVWQAKKVDESTAGTTLITWADGNASFDNTATDLTALSYS